MATTSLFFCGIGGSGMLPLAMIACGMGYRVVGSDRGYDAGLHAEKFAALTRTGIELVPQDGQGLTKDFDALIVSAAIEDTIPEVVRAKELGVPIKKRAQLLSELFNTSKMRIAVAGTSGKSTTTAMIGWCLHTFGRDPTMMNGAPLKNLVTLDNPYASSLVGKTGLFVSECDESDGSVVLYEPDIAVLTNISLDHMPLEKLYEVFGEYLRHSLHAVVGSDCAMLMELVRLREIVPPPVTFALGSPDARITAQDITLEQDGITATILDRSTNETAPLRLNILGKHNLENALAAIAALRLMDISLTDITKALGTFTGVKRRLEILGTKNGITVIDDFGHNPEKIAATLGTLHDFPGRLLICFQMHGYGPLRLMKDELVAMFARHMKSDDKLYMPDVLYMGGITDKSYDAAAFCKDLQAAGVAVTHHAVRDDLAALIRKESRAGDRIVVMGARDDSLSRFAVTILESL